MHILRKTWVSYTSAILLVGSLIGAWWLLFSQIHQGTQQIDALRKETLSRSQERQYARTSALLLRTHAEVIDRIRSLFVKRKPVEFIKKLKETGSMVGVTTALSVEDATGKDQQLVFRVS